MLLQGTVPGIAADICRHVASPVSTTLLHNALTGVLYLARSLTVARLTSARQPVFYLRDLSSGHRQAILQP